MGLLFRILSKFDEFFKCVKIDSHILELLLQFFSGRTLEDDGLDKRKFIQGLLDGRKKVGIGGDMSALTFLERMDQSFFTKIGINCSN
jgi:hypothetical protein